MIYQGDDLHNYCNKKSKNLNVFVMGMQSLSHLEAL